MKTALHRALVVAAHPDDEILGCGGTIARLVDEGCEAHTLILGEGQTSRDAQRDRAQREVDIGELRDQMQRANALIGASSAVALDFPDNRFDSVPLLDIVKSIEAVKNELQPDAIFTHFDGDLNVDHQITARAVLTAARPVSGESVKHIYAFQVLSSTYWNTPTSFAPDTFANIETTIERKVRAMEAYSAELREYPHPRSLRGLKLEAEYWGMQYGMPYCEAFKTLRAVW